MKESKPDEGQWFGSTYLQAYAVSDIITDGVVFGLHWAPPHPNAARAAAPANLDAVCLLSDAEYRPLELVHPGKVRNANGSVLHTGDSPTGASTWDDERVFAFLDAIPAEVNTLTFCIVSASGHALSEVAGARCHVSDRVMESVLLEVDLTAVGAVDHYCVASLQRCGHGWCLGPAAPDSSRFAVDMVCRAPRAGSAVQIQRRAYSY